MNQRARAFEVTEKLEAEAGAVAGTLDEPGHVGQHERVSTLELGDAEVRMERGERVRGDLGLCAGQRRQQRRLAPIRQPDQADVGDEAQFEADVALLPRIAELAGARCLPGGGGEPGVASTPTSAAGRECDGSGPVEVGEHDVAFANDRPDGDVQGQVRALMTGALATASGASILGMERTPLAEAGQRGVRGVRHDQHVTAAPTVAPIRTAVGDVLLAAKAHRSPPA